MFFFFFSIKCQKQYPTGEKLAEIHLFVNIMRRMTLFQVLGVLLNRKEQEQNFMKYGKIASRDAGMSLRPSSLTVLLL